MPISIDHYEVLSRENKRNRIVRIYLKEAYGHVPNTLIVKQPASEKYDPDDYHSQNSIMHFNDWAGTEFLSKLFDESETPLTPFFYAGDHKLGFIMEDLGTHRSMVKFNGDKIPVDANLLPMLFHGKAKQAEQNLDAWMGCLGRFHASTTGKEQQYEKIRRRLGGRGHTSREAKADWFRNFIPRLKDTLKLISLKPTDSFYDELALLANTIEDPGPFLTYVHGDACPDNCLFVDGKVRLIDFETSSFQHALLDAVYPRIAFPTCGWSYALPKSIVEKLENVYRKQLIQGCPEASDDIIFNQGIIDACAIWVISSLESLNGSLKKDLAWGVSTSRQRILTRLKALTRLEDIHNHLPVISETALRLSSKLGNLWPESEVLPVYPVFNNAVTR